MPIYEFRCSDCGRRFEARRPAEQSDAAAPACPDGHTATRRILSVFATAGRSGSSDVAAEGAFSDSAGGCGPGCACANR